MTGGSGNTDSGYLAHLIDSLKLDAQKLLYNDYATTSPSTTSTPTPIGTLYPTPGGTGLPPQTQPIPIREIVSGFTQEDREMLIFLLKKVERILKLIDDVGDTVDREVERLKQQ